jgi:sporulation protein YlmC with PRC-barrel domain
MRHGLQGKSMLALNVLRQVGNGVSHVFNPRRTFMTKNTTKDRPGTAGPGAELLGASTLNGDTVCNAQGEDLGEIREIMLDTETGRVAYAVMSFGGFLGMGDKLFAVPWAALRLNPNTQRFVLDVDRERLERAPGFDKAKWPMMADLAWAAEIHSYYRATPYWQ